MFPRQKHRPNHIQVSIENAASRVISQIHEEWDYRNVDPFDIEIGKKPEGIPSALYIDRVGTLAKEKLMKLHAGELIIGHLVSFNQPASDAASKQLPEHSGYGNSPLPVYDPRHLHVVFDRVYGELSLVQEAISETLPDQISRAA